MRRRSLIAKQSTTDFWNNFCRVNLFTYGAEDVGPVTGVEIYRDDSKSYGVDPDWAFDSVRTLRFTMIMIMIINLNDCRSGNCNLSICKLTPPKNVGTSMGFRLVASALALPCSTNWAVKTQTLGAGQFVEIILTREWNETMKMMWTAQIQI